MAEWSNSVTFFYQEEGTTHTISGSSSTIVNHKQVSQNQNSTKQLSIYYQNVRGLRTKTDSFHMGVMSGNYDIIALTETWLNSSFYDSELFDNRYTVIRRDRSENKLRGGGVLIALKKNLAYEIIPMNCESESVTIKINFKCISFFISVVYFVPNTNVELYEQYLDQFEDILLMKSSNVILLGDYNLSNFYDKNVECSRNVLMQQFINMYDLEQVNDVPNFMSRFLDLIFTNVTIHRLVRSDCPLVYEDSYHPALNLFINVKGAKGVISHKKTYIYNYAKGNFFHLYQLMSECDWSRLLTCQNVNECFKLFYDDIYRFLDDSIPRIEVKTTSVAKFPQWFSIDLVRKIKQKNRLHHYIIKNKISSSSPESTEYLLLRTEIKNLTKQEYNAHKKSIENNLVADPASFWTFFKNKTGNCGIPAEMTLDGTGYDNPLSIANAFAGYFQSVYGTSGCSNHHLDSGEWGNFYFKKISELDVLNSINKLKPKKSTGPDEIPPFIYKGCAELLAKPLAYLFNLSIEKECFPETLKNAMVTPIFKKGKKNDIRNYRPISILSSITKVFENIIYSDIYEYVKLKISKFQHGFVADKSTVTNLCILSECISEAIGDNEQLDVVYTDCEKAFDKVDHGIILNKLRNIGFSQKAFNLIKSYLVDRNQTVKIGRCFSDQYVSTSGVPQGSNLGPLLFILFINDLPSYVSNSGCLMYADDFKLYRVIKCKEDSIELQSDLNLVAQWFRSNNMTLNVGKCAVVKYTRKMNYFVDDYYIDNIQIERKNNVKDLGVHFQTNFRFNTHYCDITNRAYRMLGFVIRNSKNFRIDTIIRLYNALVRPHVEYASNIWSPTADTNINLIEKVQKRFLRYLYVKENNAYPYMISYRTLLETFKFQTLNFRRKAQATMFVYYLVNSIKYRNCDLINFISFKVPKIRLRITNMEMFHIYNTNSSPINNMLRTCNEVLNKIAPVDLFHIKTTELHRLLKHQDST